MAESVPPPPELREQPGTDAPQPKTLAERIADWTERRFRRKSDDEEAPGFLRLEAVTSGMGTAVGGVILFIAFCAFCGLLTGLWLELDKRLLPVAIELPGAIKVVLMIAGGFTAVMALLVILSDSEDKDRVLHWIFFIVVACATLSLAHNTPLPLALIIGQFCIHYIIHSGIQLRKRRREWEQQLEKEHEEDRDAKRSPAALLHKYGGVRGFAEGEEGQARAAEDDGELRRPNTPPGW